MQRCFKQLTAIFLILFQLLWLSNNGCAQKYGAAKIDSLKIDLLHAQHDTISVRLLNRIGFEFQNIYNDSVKVYGDSALKLANKIKWAKGISSSYNTMGVYYMSRAQYMEALKFYLDALKINDSINNTVGIAVNLLNIGVAYANLEEHERAITYYLKALNKALEIDRWETIALAYLNLSKAYYSLKQFKKSLVVINSGLQFTQSKRLKDLEAYLHKNRGMVWLELGFLDKADSSLHVAANMNEQLGLISETASSYYFLGKLRLNQIAKIGSKNSLKLKQDAVLFFNKSIALYKQSKNELELYKVYQGLSEANAFMQDFEQAYSNYVIYHQLKDSIFSAENQRNIARLEAKKEIELKDKLLENEKKLSGIQRIYFVSGLLVLSIFLILILKERRKSDRLLLNILPKDIAHRLKQKEKYIADRVNEVTIVFIDIVGFTALSSKTDPAALVLILDGLFKQFDALAEEFKLEKIKTIGDCYMAVSGLPKSKNNHAELAAKMALKLLDQQSKICAVVKQDLQFRIGIDYGEVVAGVIGNSKFTYDLWGDAVNMASRMESNGAPGKIHCTERFKLKLEHNFNFEYNNQLNIKGKGKMNTWFLTAQKHQHLTTNI